MIRIVAFALFIALGAPATAQVTGAIPGAVGTTGPRLKELVVVTGETVRIGDLVENAGPAAGVAVFRSPDLGYTGGVPVPRVLEVLARYRLASLDTGGISEVVVTRLSRAITEKEIEAQIARALAGRYGFGDAEHIAITLDRQIRTIHVESTATGNLQIARLNVDQRSGRFDVAFELPDSAVLRRHPLRFAGTAAETVETTVLLRALNRGDVIRRSDVVMERRSRVEYSGDLVALDAAVGFAAKRPLTAGAVLRPNDLAKPEVVQRNESVTIVYEVPGVLLTARGKALESGAIGDVVNVLNIQSNRTVQATIVSAGRVRVAATGFSTITTTTEPVPSNTAPSSAE